MKKLKYLSVLLACFVLCSCSKKSTVSEMNIEPAQSAPVAVTEPPTLPPSDVPSVQESTQEVQQETAPTAETPKYSDYMTLFNTYHQAYLDNNSELIYSLFNPDEIQAYKNYMENYYGDTMNFDSVFSHDSIISAINASIANINVIKSQHMNTPEDVWAVLVNSTELTHLEPSDLENMSVGFGIEIADGYYCEYPYYENQSKGEKFVGEPAVAVQIGDSWYISFAGAMDRLIEFMDVFNS